jgi:hypothetical protein
LCGSTDTAQIYYELLEHRWLLSEQAGCDAGLEATVEDYARTVLSHRTAP